MILSFHPIIEADQNILCAGRAPDTGDLAAIKSAAAVILPQGCTPDLYRMARANCAHIFPNMDVRFDYPAKDGQIRLFRKLGIAHPHTDLYDSMDAFNAGNGSVKLPAVVKLNWGGQGRTVFRAGDGHELAVAFEQVRACEQTGQSGFIIQQFIPHQNRSLRVAVIGTRLISYWRLQTRPDQFGTSVDKGACVDPDTDPHMQAITQTVVRDFCAQTGLQLGGFDFIFDQRALDQGQCEPLMLEINYFFGRHGLGGSQKFYEILAWEVDRWLAALP